MLGTPEELGKVLLRALKTNDKNLWVSCVHPDIDNIHPGYDDLRGNFAKDFERVRTWFIQHGITQWNQAIFSRVTFDSRDNGLHAIDFRLEFNYKGHEFVGGLEIPSTLQYKGKYFMVTTVDDFVVGRPKR